MGPRPAFIPVRRSTIENTAPTSPAEPNADGTRMAISPLQTLSCQPATQRCGFSSVRTPAFRAASAVAASPSSVSPQ